MHFGKRFFQKSLAALLCLSLLLLLPFSVSLTAADTDAVSLSEEVWLWPVPGSYRINSLDTYNTGGTHNQGQCVDISCNGYSGDVRLDVISATSGSVFYICDSYDEETNKGSGWGNYVIVQSGDVMILYGHLQSVSCSYGPIQAGDVIGKMGNTGTSTGVHLHLQAYPAGSTPYSNEIYIFDAFKDNSLYNTSFEFWDGLQTYSERYGTWIREFFTKKNGVYYAYSGGLTASYPTTPLSAQVTVVASSGAAQYPSPVATQGTSVGTFAAGTVVSVDGYYLDAYGSTWLRVADTSPERWIRQADVGFYAYNYGTELQNGALPSGTYSAFSHLSFGGTLVSDNVITSLTAEVLSGTKVVSSYSRSISASTFDCSLILASAFSKTSLTDGSYTLRLSVTETASYPGADSTSQTSVVATSTFTIDSTLSDLIPPTLHSFAIRSLTSSGITFFLDASDNNAVGSVTAQIVGNEKTFNASFTKGTDGYSLTVAASSLADSGDYTATVTVSDIYGNITTVTRTFTLPPTQSGEVWTIKADATPYVRVRTTPQVVSGNTTSYRLYPGTQVVVTEFVDDGTYVWGKCSYGWFVTSFADYTGAVYSVHFDLNGSDDTAIPSVDQPYGGEITLPTTIPTREGCEFLGWATSSDAATAAYTAGGKFTTDRSITLFAVWKTVTYTLTTPSALTASGQYLIAENSVMTAASLLASLEVNGSVVIKNGSGQTVTDSYALLGTGTTVAISCQNGTKATLTLIVLGDTDGDGTVTQSDVTTILKLSNGMIAPTTNDLRMIAADLDGDGAVTSTDAFLASLRT